MSAYLDWTLRQSRNRSVMVDTNLLLLLIVGTVNTDLIYRFKRTEIYSGDDLHHIQETVRRFRQVTAVQPVLTEVSNLVGQLTEPARRAVMLELRQYILDVHEVQSSSVELSRLAEFPRFGLADSALIDAASKGEVVFTDDFPLSGYIERLGFPVLNLFHLRGEQWLS